MSGFVVLRGESNEDCNFPFQDAELFRDPKALLEVIQRDPSKILWVAIAPDFANPSGVAQQIRDVDPTVSVILLGPDWASAEGVPDVLRAAVSEPGSGVDLAEHKETERILRETQRRAFEAENLASITAGIAHDVGTPMTAILGYAELLAKSVGDEKNRKRATTIIEQVHRVSELIETLMNLSRTEDRPHRPVELDGILDKALDFYREKFGRLGVEVERHFGPAPQILGDPNRLHQVLLSLLLNALEAMPQGGALRVSLAETDTAEAEIRVSDTGPAIDPDLRARVFEPYFSTKQRASRAGLGLLVAKTIVEQHGGRIALTSEPDHGTTEFRLTFPRLPENAS